MFMVPVARACTVHLGLGIKIYLNLKKMDFHDPMRRKHRHHHGDPMIPGPGRGDSHAGSGWPAEPGPTVLRVRLELPVAGDNNPHGS